MAGPFKLKSGNSPLFKDLGSSPVHTHMTGVPHKKKKKKTTEERLKEIEQMQDWWSKKGERAKATKQREKKQREKEAAEKAMKEGLTGRLKRSIGGK